MKKILYISISILILSMVLILLIDKNVYSDDVDYPPIHKLDWIQKNAVQKINSDGTIHIKIDNNDSFNTSFKNAIIEWNQLHIVKLKIIKPSNEICDDASITLHVNNNSQEDSIYKPNHAATNNTDVLGYTSNSSNDYKIGKYHFNVIVGSNIFIMNKISHWSIKQKTRIITHEIGHALGFNDDINPKDKLLIMYGMNDQTNNNKIKISDSEKITLKDHYEKYLKLLKIDKAKSIL